MTDNAAIDKLHSIWDRFVSDVGEVLKGITPEAEKDAEELAADAVKEAEAADAHLLDRSTPQSNVEPESTTSGDSSVPADPTEAGEAPVSEPPAVVATPAEPKPNIDPGEDQTGDTVGAAEGKVGVDAPVAVTTTTETFGAVPGQPAESESLGTTTTTMPVVTDPAATAAAAEAEALAHPSVSGEAGTPPPPEVAAWLAANHLAAVPKPA